MFLFRLSLSTFFFFNDTATTEIYTLSLHDALPIFHEVVVQLLVGPVAAIPRRVLDGISELVVGGIRQVEMPRRVGEDRKSTRLNSSHQIISYAVFCLKKKNS